MSGPASSVDSQFALFDSTTGKLMKAATSSGVCKAASGVASFGSVSLATEVTGQLPATNGGTGLSSLGAANQILAVNSGGSALVYQTDRSNVTLGKITGANFNSTSDQPITVSAGKYIVTKFVVTNASTSLTLAAGGIYTAASKGGTAVVAAAQVYSALTVASKFLNLTLDGVLGTDVRTEGTLYLSLTLAQGSAATADVYLIGDRLE